MMIATKGKKTRVARDPRRAISPKYASSRGAKLSCAMVEMMSELAT
jgi:hypothetical protein